MAFKNFFSKTKLATFFLIANFFSVTNLSKAQALIPATTPDSYHTPTSFQNFALPTATDIAFIGANTTIQAVVANTTGAALYWDDNNGNKGSYNINNSTVPTLPASTAFYVDDVACAFNIFGDVFAYVSCRAVLANGNTEIHIIPFRWSGSDFSIPPGSTTYLDVRPTTVNNFDGVKLAVPKAVFPNATLTANEDNGIGVAYSKNGTIYASWGNVNFSNGTIAYSATQQTIMPGTMPTILRSKIAHPTLNTFPLGYVIGAINGNNVTVKDNMGLYGTQVLYTSSNTLRSFDLTNNLQESFPYMTVMVVNELDIANSKSIVKLVSNKPSGGNLNQELNLNAEYELSCGTNSKYKYIGFPKIVAYYTCAPGHGYYRYEVVWQQMLCVNGSQCKINAISKRVYTDVSNPTSNPFMVANFGDAINLSSNNTSINGYFPDLVYKDASYFNTTNNGVRINYSFATMNLNTNANGNIAYKKSGIVNNNSGCVQSISDILKTNSNGLSDKIDESNIKNRLELYPNPVNNKLSINANKLIDNIEIFNTNGVKMGNYKFNGVYNTSISTSPMVNGIYFVKVRYINRYVETQKIVINH